MALERPGCYHARQNAINSKDFGAGQLTAHKPLEEHATETGLVYARLLDGKGGDTVLDWEGVSRHRSGEGLLWIHLEQGHEEAHRWLFERSGVDELTASALVAEETRPRIRIDGDSLFVILRGVNLNPGRDPDDMVAVRMLFQPDRIITLRSDKVMAIQDVRESLQAGKGPKEAGDFLAMMSNRLVERMNEAIRDLDETLDSIEEVLADGNDTIERHALGRTRRIAITLRRYLAPQRDVITQLMLAQMDWWREPHRQLMREVADRVTRHVEDLDAIRERSAVIHDELTTRQAEHMNRTMYLLSIVAVIFLPLGLLTGLLGINVGGIPGTQHHYAFAVVCLLLVVLAAGLIAAFRYLRWL